MVCNPPEKPHLGLGAGGCGRQGSGLWKSGGMPRGLGGTPHPASPPTHPAPPPDPFQAAQGLVQTNPARKVLLGHKPTLEDMCPWPLSANP